MQPIHSYRNFGNPFGGGGNPFGGGGIPGPVGDVLNKAGEKLGIPGVGDWFPGGSAGGGGMPTQPQPQGTPGTVGCWTNPETGEEICGAMGSSGSSPSGGGSTSTSSKSSGGHNPFGDIFGKMGGVFQNPFGGTPWTQGGTFPGGFGNGTIPGGWTQNGDVTMPGGWTQGAGKPSTGSWAPGPFGGGGMPGGWTQGGMSGGAMPGGWTSGGWQPGGSINISWPTWEQVEKGWHDFEDAWHKKWDSVSKQSGRWRKPVASLINKWTGEMVDQAKVVTQEAIDNARQEWENMKSQAQSQIMQQVQNEFEALKREAQAIGMEWVHTNLGELEGFANQAIEWGMEIRDAIIQIKKMIEEIKELLSNFNQHCTTLYKTSINLMALKIPIINKTYQLKIEICYPVDPRLLGEQILKECQDYTIQRASQTVMSAAVAGVATGGPGLIPILTQGFTTAINNAPRDFLNCVMKHNTRFNEISLRVLIE